MAERNCVTVSYCSLWGGARRREGGLTVSYCHENNLLHLNLGCHPKWDFCHHKWDCKIPSGVADFSNEFLQKLNQITVKRGGRARAAAHTSHFRWQNFKYSIFITESIKKTLWSDNPTWSVSIYWRKTIEITIFPFKMTEVIKRLYLKFCHLKWDVRAPAPPCALLFSQ